jgi:hypothetical protein
VPNYGGFGGNCINLHGTLKTDAMDRKEFLSTMMLLGGATLLPADVSALNKLAAAGTRNGSRRIDESKVVLMADIHISGELKDGIPIKYPYNPTSLNLRIKEILQMRPLPANVVILGDVAWDYGLEEDYRYAAQLLKPLQDAGIKVTLGLGNHDRRAAFFKVNPEYAAKSPVPGRAVSIVNLPTLDIIVLDSLAELPGLKPKQGTTVSGELDEKQIGWLESYLANNKRPVILSAHHPMTEMPKLSEIITRHPSVVAYVYGHSHIWSKTVRILRPRVPQRMVPVVCLPATFYGDIGLSVMNLTETGATIEYSSKGFWWPQPQENPPKEWELRMNDLQNEKCTLLF